MKKITTKENPNLDTRFRHLFYGDLEIGQLIITKKSYFVTMLGKEFLYPLYQKHNLQSSILSDYLFIVRQIAHETGESRFNNDGIDLQTYKKLERPTGTLKNSKLISLKDGVDS
jgi:hypothetical protein